MRELGLKAEKVLRQAFISDYYHYISQVTNGKRIAGMMERSMIQRQQDDLARARSDDWPWVFSWERATAPLVWMAANLCFPDGTKMDKVLRLEPWQVFLVMVLYGWVNGTTGVRRYMDAYIEIPRKNGKSTLAGALIDYMAFSEAEGRGSPCYIGATSLDQAGDTFRRAVGCLRKWEGNGLRVADSKNNKEIVYGRQRITAISAAPKDGKLSHCFLCDEYHQHVSNELINSIVSGSVSDPESITIRITTAGTNLQGVCKQEHDKCVRILQGVVRTDRYFVAIYCPDDGDDISSPITWEKANPNWGVSVDIDSFKARWEYVKDSESDRVDFQTKNLNRWVDSNTRWANMPVWREKCCHPIDNQSLEGRWCCAGLDLSGNSDFTAFTLDFPEDGEEGVRHIQTHMFWVPENRVTMLERQLRVPLRQWVRQGLVQATPGDVVDYAVVAQYIEDAHKRYDLQLIACDKWKIDNLERNMPDWFQDVAIIFSQGMMSMSPSIKEFERNYLLGNIANDNPVETWMMSCADSKQDEHGNVKLVKPALGRSASRIDGVITAIMAFDTSSTHWETGLSEGDVSSSIFFA